MPIVVVQGDLFLAGERFLCHQCNCKTTRAAHLAADVFRRFPYADIYKERTSNDDPSLRTPGNIVVRGDGPARKIIAMLGQVFPGKPKFPSSDLDGFASRRGYFRSALDKMALLDHGSSFAFPWGIGCGAAGGCWPDYLEMIEDFARKTGLDVKIYRRD